MSIPFKAALGAVAVLVVAVSGYLLLGGAAPPPGGVGASSGGEPSPALSPTAAATPRSIVGINTPLPPGDYRLVANGPVAAVVTVPAGWVGWEPFAVLGPRYSDGPDGVGISLNAPTGLYPDPCHWKPGSDPSTLAIEVGPTADDLVDAIVASPTLDAGVPTPITVDGHSGKEVELRVPSDVDFAACDDGNWHPLSNSDQVIYAQGPGNIWRVLVLDVDGERVVVIEAFFEATPAADKAEADAILDSLRIDP